MSGTLTQFPTGSTQYKINFEYLARAFVVVTLVNSSDSSQNRVLTVGNDYTFLNPTTIFVTANQSGYDIIQIHRETSTGLIVDFRDGSVLTASDLTNAELQAIHIAEEGRDQTIERGRQYADAAEKAAEQGKQWYDATKDLLVENGVDSTLRSDLAGPNGYTLVPSVPSRTEFDTLSNSINNAKFQNIKTTGEMKRWLQEGGNINSIFFGDSTFYGATPGNLAQASAWNPPATFKKVIMDLYGVDIKMQNWAISGSTLRGCITGDDQGNPGNGQTMEQRLVTILNQWPTLPAIVYCNHGINDSQLNLSIDQFRLDVITFIETCRKHNAVPVYVTPNANSPYLIIDYPKEKRLHSFVKVIRDVCNAMGVDVVDNFYYFQQTLKRVPATTLIPDGAHPSHHGYRMAGANLAIPLVNAHTLKHVGQRAPISGSTVFDNIRVNRNLQYRVENTFGMALTGEVDGNGPQGMNFPVILDEPTHDTVLCIHGVRWPSGCTGNINYFGFGSDQYGGHMTNFSASTIQWDSMFVPEICNLYAGLHVIGMLWNPVSGEGNGYGVSGLSLQNRRFTANANFRKNDMLTLGDNTKTTFTFPFNLGTSVQFRTFTDDTVMMAITLSSAGRLTLDFGGVAYELGASDIAANTYPVSISIKGKQVDVTVGALSKTFSLPQTPPEMYPATHIYHYSVERCLSDTTWVDPANSPN